MRLNVFVIAAILLATGTEALVIGETTLRVYYGTKNRSGSKGIYTGRLDLKTGTLSEPQLAIEAENAGFVAISNSGRFLYAVASGESGQRIVAYAIGERSGKLTELNSRESGGANPCHVSVGSGDRYVTYANYSGGSCGLMPLAKDGTLKAGGSFFQHEGGSGINKGRQEAPHPHSARTDPHGRFVMVPDLGQDKVRVYRLENDGTSMAPNDPPFAVTPPGGGPRHVTFHPNARWMYVNNELTSSVTVFDLDDSTGATQSKQTITTLPAEFAGLNSTAEILAHPNGRFLYCSNRGHDSIASFTINQTTGELTALGHTKSGGKTPRNFGITSDGQYLVAANHTSGDVVAFKVDLETGQLTQSSRTKVPHCICVRFVD